MTQEQQEQATQQATESNGRSLADLIQIVMQAHIVDYAGHTLQQAVSALCTANDLFLRVAEIEGLREDMRTYGVEMAGLLTPIVEKAGELARDRADALEPEMGEDAGE